jgi:hypothetical protein
MRQDDAEKEKEVAIEFANLVMDAKQKLGIQIPDFISHLINIIGFSLPLDFDEEYLREFSKATHSLWNHILTNREQWRNEPMQDMQKGV